MTSTIERLAELAKGATPGEWRAYKVAPEPKSQFDGVIMCAGGALGYSAGHKPYHTNCNWFMSNGDAEYIAACNPAAIAQAHAEYAALERRNAELVEALSFYADDSRYQGPNQRRNGPDKWSEGAGLSVYRIDVSRDGGSIAKAALAHTSRERETSPKGETQEKADAAE